MSTIQAFDFSIDILRSLLWRNNDAVNLQALLQDKQDFVDSENETFWDDWLVDVFDLRTANVFGLNVWSIILGLNITIEPEPSETPNESWGFGEFRKNFTHGNFTNSQAGFALTAQQARLVLRLRYYQLVSRADVSGINRILEDVFGDLGSSYVIDNLDMSIKYVFQFPLTSALLFVLEAFDVLPRPAGVDIETVIDISNTNWGFGSFRRNFNNGNFSAV